jgi:hypothetical protein
MGSEFCDHALILTIHWRGQWSRKWRKGVPLRQFQAEPESRGNSDDRPKHLG